MSWMGWLLGFLILMSIFGKITEEKKKQEAAKEAERRRKEAEDYIMNSGDQEAIKMLMMARANPASNGQFMNGASAGGNDTLKTAMAVAAGVAVGQTVANAAAASAMASALNEAAKASVDPSNLGDLF